jgi:hypothetical protein
MREEHFAEILVDPFIVTVKDVSRTIFQRKALKTRTDSGRTPRAARATVSVLRLR